MSENEITKNNNGGFTMKKYVLSLLLTVAVLFAFTACALLPGPRNDAALETDVPEPIAEPPTPAPDETEPEYPPLQLIIYLTPENAVAIEANVPLRNVAWVRLDQDFVDDEIIFIPGDERIGMIEELLPGSLFPLADFIDNGTFPTNAIAFTDPYGEQRYFAFMMDNSFGLDPSPYMPDFLDNVVDGQVRIHTTRGDGSRSDLGAFDVDTDNFDPDEWFAANRYRWAAHLMVIWEIENTGQQ